MMQDKRRHGHSGRKLTDRLSAIGAIEAARIHQKQESTALICGPGLLLAYSGQKRILSASAFKPLTADYQTMKQLNKYQKNGESKK